MIILPLLYAYSQSLYGHSLGGKACSELGPVCSQRPSRLAMLEARVVLGTLVKRFEFVSAAGAYSRPLFIFTSPVFATVSTKGLTLVRFSAEPVCFRGDVLVDMVAETA